MRKRNNLTPEQTSVKFTDPSLTEQSHRNEVRTQTILRKYAQTGLMPHQSSKQPSFMNLAHAPDFHQAMNTVAAARQTFENIPAKIRSEFGNDPEQFLTFIHDPENREKMEAMNFPTDHLPQIPTPPPVNELCF